MLISGDIIIHEVGSYLNMETLRDLRSVNKDWYLSYEKRKEDVVVKLSSCLLQLDKVRKVGGIIGGQILTMDVLSGLEEVVRKEDLTQNIAGDILEEIKKVDVKSSTHKLFRAALECCLEDSLNQAPSC